MTVKPNVILLNHTPDPVRAIAIAARLCYSPLGASDLKEGMSDEACENLIKNLLASGHMSAFEHASFTFAIDNTSRACTHQLVRHRVASYNQQSQRYVTYNLRDESVATIIPDSIKENIYALEAFQKAMKAINEAYETMIDHEIPAEDARYILPNACETKIVVTMNARELLHFFSLRCCNRAQWEIRHMADEMLRLCREVAPLIFKCAGPACITSGKCPEGKMSCSNPRNDLKVE